jgi:hypothetical protein|tara:strand:- start:732 stop:1214 length:483 start_codon:yes stop_codon:yes gene_type:complete
MKHLISFVFLAVFAATAHAQTSTDTDGDTPDAVALWQEDHTTIFAASEVNLSEFVWIARPVIVFADSENDPNFRRQIELLQERPEFLAERDVVIITDSRPDDPSDARTRLRPRGFMLVLMGKDGQIELRKPAPWTVREISRSIDKMPLRAQEVEDRRAAP